MPIHIACLELIIDPACTLVFEAEKPPADLMRRPSRRNRLFDRPMLITGLTQGLIALAVVLGIVGLGVALGVSEEELRSLTFASIVLSNIALLLAYLASAIPPLARIFHMAPLPAWAWVTLCIGAVLTTVLLHSVHALARRPGGSAPA